MQVYTKETLISAIQAIKQMGWIANKRPGNAGGIGNTLEDLLGIKENNLPLPNAAEWELKCQRLGSSALTTLFHMEPSPIALNLVVKMLLPFYGWQHALAGRKYPENERSFRQTIHSLSHSDRGFTVQTDDKNRRVVISFDSAKVDARHEKWLACVKENIGLGELNPQPYWGFDDLFHKAGTKLRNCFFVQADVMRKDGQEFYHYQKIYMLQGFELDNFLSAIKNGNILVDFDARTGHNHGTKFRLKQNAFPSLYADVKNIN